MAVAGGVTEAVLYLVDYEQRNLLPLPGSGTPAREPLDIDVTVGGRSFRDVAVLDGRTSRGWRLWVPLLDGTTRLGVAEFVTDTLDDSMRRWLRQFASLVSELLVTKDMYSDFVKKMRRRQPMTLAAEMQWSLLPPLTFATNTVAVSGMLEPSYEIAGDSFDYAYENDMMRLAIIDAMGHGFAATLLSTITVNAYRHSRRLERSLTDTYAAMDDAFRAVAREDQFATAVLAELDARAGRLRWVNAGHPAPLLLRAGRAVGSLVCQPSLPVGLGAAPAEVGDIQLEPGDAVVLFTDGIVEARSAAGEFGEARLADFIGRALAAGSPPPETLRRLTHAVLDYQSGELQDDASILLLHWYGRQSGEQALPPAS